MTTIQRHLGRPPAPATTWTHPGSGHWIAARDGEGHIGHVELADGRFRAVDARGTIRGDYDRLEDAKLSVLAAGTSRPWDARRNLVFGAAVAAVAIAACAMAMLGHMI